MRETPDFHRKLLTLQCCLRSMLLGAHQRCKVRRMLQSMAVILQIMEQAGPLFLVDSTCKC